MTLHPTAPGMESAKFRDPVFTAKGERRATIGLKALRTLWFNTGTLCNIECGHCYIESSPGNDRLAYLTLAEMFPFIEEIAARRLPVREIGFTGGEPFMNPDCCAMIGAALEGGFTALVLTNAMRPMMRPRVQRDLLALGRSFGGRLTLRVSLDHYTERLHDAERGAGSWVETMKGLRWLSEHGFTLAIAGRRRWEESTHDLRRGYGELFVRERLDIDSENPASLVLFPEMDASVDVPEITVDCWRLLNVDPADVMCATSRMVVKRKGAARPTVVACTLIPYDAQFEFGTTLAEADRDVALNHPHCAKFCVLGGGSCSAAG